jgi:hypothetical protein
VVLVCERKNNRYNSIAVGPVAQLVEQRIENPRVGGSIPPQATKNFSLYIKDLQKKAASQGSPFLLPGGRFLQIPANRPAGRGAARHIGGVLVRSSARLTSPRATP